MKIEQAIIANLRKLSIEKQQEVLSFTESLTKTNIERSRDVSSLPTPNPNLSPSERAEKWCKFVDSHASDNPPLPEAALHRDTMYED